MKEKTMVLVSLSKDEDYALNLHQAKLSRMNLKKSKAELIVKLMMIGLQQEDRILTEHLK